MSGRGPHIKGKLTGKLRIGGGGNSNSEPLGRLMLGLSDRYPEVEAVVQHGDSLEVLDGIRAGMLDVGFYNEPAQPPDNLRVIEVASFVIHLAAPAGLLPAADEIDWQALAELPWIYPTGGPSCCGHAAESLFRRHQFRPRRTISIDRESVTRALIASGVGVGLLHTDTALDARTRGEVDLLCDAQDKVSVMFAHLGTHTKDPLIDAAARILLDTIA